MADANLKTIEELKNWFYVTNRLSSDNTHIYIDADINYPLCFGIYKDNSTNTIVLYKNEIHGERTIWYQGSDEQYAVNEMIHLVSKVAQSKGKELHFDNKSEQVINNNAIYDNVNSDVDKNEIVPKKDLAVNTGRGNMFCKYCGAQLEEGAKVCSACGGRLDEHRPYIVHDEVVGVLDWIVTFILLAIPIINVIYFIGLALGISNKHSKVNWVRAILLPFVVWFIVMIAMGAGPQIVDSAKEFVMKLLYQVANYFSK